MGPRRVLLVQEDATNAYLLRRALARWGYTVEHLPHAEKLSAALAGGARPDLVLVDHALAAERDALELVGELRRQGERIPVILIGGRQDEVSQARAQRAGVGAIVPKPFALAELQAQLSGS